MSLMGRLLVAGTFGKFPQLFHVLRGDMSLVGPAAIVPGELERYGEYGALMLSVKPGVIGHWRVRGGQNPVDYGHRAKCDMNHIGGQPSSLDVGMPGEGTDACGTSEGAN
jgi:lipopolysaccharide/colanic/teichoic acid biosynthesis glycosyltransferase